MRYIADTRNNVQTFQILSKEGAVELDLYQDDETWTRDLIWRTKQRAEEHPTFYTKQSLYDKLTRNTKIQMKCCFAYKKELTHMHQIALWVSSLSSTTNEWLFFVGETSPLLRICWYRLKDRITETHLLAKNTYIIFSQFPWTFVRAFKSRYKSNVKSLKW